MDERINKIRGHADILLNALYGLRGNLELLKPLLFKKSVVDEYSAGGRARGFSMIRRTLLFSCVLDITRLAFDDDRRVPSILNLINALQDDALRKAFQENHSRRDTYGEIWAQILTRWTEFNAKAWAEPFKTIRDKWIAHLEVKRVDGEYKPLDISSFDLKWGDPEEAIGLLEPIMLDIMLAVRDQGIVIDFLKNDYARSAKAFWKVP